MNDEPKIAIVDYGVGNLYSLAQALRHCGVEPIITEDAQTLENSNGVILPGVGAFQTGMHGLELRGLTSTIKKIAASGKPILGICLGAQLLLSEGYEFGVFRGLDLIPGKVVHFPPLANNEKVPHIGWNNLSPSKEKWEETIFNSTQENDQVYFVHSYILKPQFEENILATTKYGNYTFCSAIKKGNMYGCQFHPEKSGEVGLKIFKEFINLIKNNA